MTTIKHCFFDKMRFLNQNASYVGSEPKTDENTEAPSYTYFPNEVACAPIAAAMVIRSVIEHSQGRFDNLAQDSELLNLTSTRPPPIDSSNVLGVDFWDVALMQHLVEKMGYVDANGNPANPANIPASKDHDFTQGLGLGLAAREKEFLEIVEPGGDIYATPREELPDRNCPQNPDSRCFTQHFPWFTDEHMRGYLEVGAGIVLTFNFYRPFLDANGEIQRDGNGFVIWRNASVEHAVAVSGFVEHPDFGLMFSLHDPFGLKQGERKVVFPSLFFTQKHGLLSYNHFIHLDTPATLVETLSNGQEVFAPSSESTNAYGHPVFIESPFAISSDPRQAVARIVNGVVILILNKDPQKLTCISMDSEALVGTQDPVPPQPTAQPGQTTGAPPSEAPSTPGFPDLPPGYRDGGPAVVQVPTGKAPGRYAQ